jgi:hypothetical protein
LISFSKSVPSNKKKIAFITLDNIVGKKHEFVGRDDGTIWLIGRKDYSASLPSLGNFAEPNEEMIKELIGRAEQSLKKLGVLEIVGKGRAIRPATDSVIPIISEVEAKDISDNRCISEEAGRELNRAFVSWGHDAYGLTLGMGTGKLMSQLVIGKGLISTWQFLISLVITVLQPHRDPSKKGWVMKSLVCNSLKYQPAARIILQNFIWLRGNILLAFGRLVDYKLEKSGQEILPYHRASYQKLFAFCAN